MLKTLLTENATRVMLLILTLLALPAGLYLAKPILAPILFAVVLGMVISPLADHVNKFGTPRVVISALLLGVVSSIIVGFFLALEPLITGIVQELPNIKREIEGWVDVVSGILQGVQSISAEIEQTVGDQEAELGSGIPTVMDAVWLAPNFGAQIFIFAGTLFFFTLTRNDLYEYAGRFSMTFFKAEKAVAKYFGAVAIVNTGLGIVTAIVLSVLGVNGAVLWGIAAGLLNFVLYLGPLIVIVGLLITGLTQFGGAMALLPPLSFLVLNIIEAQFVTPAFVGHRLNLNPLIVFMAIVFGLWIWGPVGAIVALPLLLWAGVILNPREHQKSQAKVLVA
ncbi:AI-2E family transporter [Pseudaestuariivita rosea]|uniref:AI-2E family transporter n=1 Tax=Pseudaestuariivita rosea TaxID=2763263 RepID=UPI001ABA8543|nr:AI-2E family transporter [Pseudaestuariivita rosea]